MKDLNDYFVIAFLSPQIAFTRLLRFGARALGRMTKNNPGNFLDTRIAALTAALAAAETCVTDVGLKAAIRAAKTESKKAFREALPAHIRRIHGSVAGVYGDPSPELTECFPKGRSVFSNCNDEELNNELAQLVGALANKTVDAGIKTLAQAQLTNWTTIDAAQGSAKDDVTDSTEVQTEKREALAIELQMCVHTVALKYPGDFAKCDYYFPQQLLRRPSARTVPDKAKLTADPFSPQSRHVVLHGSADGADQIRFLRRMAGETDFSPIAEVEADEGSADYEDTLSASGDFEYIALGLKGTAEGEASAVLTVHAT